MSDYNDYRRRREQIRAMRQGFGSPDPEPEPEPTPDPNYSVTTDPKYIFNDPAPAPEPGMRVNDWLALGTRVGGGFLGGMGGPIGGLVGGGSEMLAQVLEGRNPLSAKGLTAVGVEAGLGAIPGAKLFKAGKVIQSAIRGGAMGGAGSLLRQAEVRDPEKKQLFDFSQVQMMPKGKGLTGLLTSPSVVRDAVFGMGIGGALGKFIKEPVGPVKPAADKLIVESNQHTGPGTRIFNRGKMKDGRIDEGGYKTQSGPKSTQTDLVNPDSNRMYSYGEGRPPADPRSNTVNPLGQMLKTGASKTYPRTIEDSAREAVSIGHAAQRAVSGSEQQLKLLRMLRGQLEEIKGLKLSERPGIQEPAANVGKSLENAPPTAEELQKEIADWYAAHPQYAPEHNVAYDTGHHLVPKGGPREAAPRAPQPGVEDQLFDVLQASRKVESDFPEDLRSVDRSIDEASKIGDANRKSNIAASKLAEKEAAAEAKAAAAQEKARSIDEIFEDLVAGRIDAKVAAQQLKAFSQAKGLRAIEENARIAGGEGLPPTGGAGTPPGGPRPQGPTAPEAPTAPTAKSVREAAAGVKANEAARQGFAGMTDDELKGVLALMDRLGPNEVKPNTLGNWRALIDEAESRGFKPGDATITEAPLRAPDGSVPPAGPKGPPPPEGPQGPPPPAGPEPPAPAPVPAGPKPGEPGAPGGAAASTLTDDAAQALADSEGVPVRTKDGRTFQPRVKPEPEPLPTGEAGGTFTLYRNGEPIRDAQGKPITFKDRGMAANAAKHFKGRVTIREAIPEAPPSTVAQPPQVPEGPMDWSKFGTDVNATPVDESRLNPSQLARFLKIKGPLEDIRFFGRNVGATLSPEDQKALIDLERYARSGQNQAKVRAEFERLKANWRRSRPEWGAAGGPKLPPKPGPFDQGTGPIPSGKQINQFGEVQPGLGGEEGPVTHVVEPPIGGGKPVKVEGKPTPVTLERLLSGKKDIEPFGEEPGNIFAGIPRKPKAPEPEPVVPNHPQEPTPTPQAGGLPEGFDIAQLGENRFAVTRDGLLVGRATSEAEALALAQNLAQKGTKPSLGRILKPEEPEVPPPPSPEVSSVGYQPEQGDLSAGRAAARDAGAARLQEMFPSLEGDVATHGKAPEGVPQALFDRFGPHAEPTPAQLAKWAQYAKEQDPAVHKVMNYLAAHFEAEPRTVMVNGKEVTNQKRMEILAIMRQIAPREPAPKPPTGGNSALGRMLQGDKQAGVRKGAPRGKPGGRAKGPKGEVPPKGGEGFGPNTVGAAEAYPDWSEDVSLRPLGSTTAKEGGKYDIFVGDQRVGGITGDGEIWYSDHNPRQGFKTAEEAANYAISEPISPPTPARTIEERFVLPRTENSPVIRKSGEFHVNQMDGAGDGARFQEVGDTPSRRAVYNHETDEWAFAGNPDFTHDDIINTAGWNPERAEAYPKTIITNPTAKSPGGDVYIYMDRLLREGPPRVNDLWGGVPMVRMRDLTAAEKNEILDKTVNSLVRSGASRRTFIHVINSNDENQTRDFFGQIGNLWPEKIKGTEILEPSWAERVEPVGYNVFGATEDEGGSALSKLLEPVQPKVDIKKLEEDAGYFAGDDYWKKPGFGKNTLGAAEGRPSPRTRAQWWQQDSRKEGQLLLPGFEKETKVASLIRDEDKYNARLYGAERDLENKQDINFWNRMRNPDVEDTTGKRLPWEDLEPNHQEPLPLEGFQVKSEGFQQPEGYRPGQTLPWEEGHGLPSWEDEMRARMDPKPDGVPQEQWDAKLGSENPNPPIERYNYPPSDEYDLDIAENATGLRFDDQGNVINDTNKFIVLNKRTGQQSLFDSEEDANAFVRSRTPNRAKYPPDFVRIIPPYAAGPLNPLRNAARSFLGDVDPEKHTSGFKVGDSVRTTDLGFNAGVEPRDFPAGRVKGIDTFQGQDWLDIEYPDGKVVRQPADLFEKSPWTPETPVGGSQWTPDDDRMFSDNVYFKEKYGFGPEGKEGKDLKSLLTPPSARQPQGIGELLGGAEAYGPEWGVGWGSREGVVPSEAAERLGFLEKEPEEWFSKTPFNERGTLGAAMPSGVSIEDLMDTPAAGKAAQDVAEGRVRYPDIVPSVTRHAELMGLDPEEMALRYAEQGPAEIVEAGVAPKQTPWNRLLKFLKGEGSGPEEGGGPGFLGDDTGSMTTGAALRMGTTAGGALIGAGLDPDNPLEGAIIGGAIGAGIPSMPQVLEKFGVPRNLRESVFSQPMDYDQARSAAKTIWERLPQIQRFNLLSGWGIIPNAAVGPYGSGVMGALESALTGDPRGRQALNILMNPANFARLYKESYNEAMNTIGRAEGRAMSEMPTGFDKTLALPGTFMTAGDIAIRKILMTAGYTADEARIITLTSEPDVALFKKLANLRGSPGMDLLFPFRRTPLNIAEQGLRRTPFVGFIAQLLRENPDAMTKQIVQQAIGGATGLANYEMAANVDPETAKWLRRYSTNFAGQYSLPAALGFAAGMGARRGKTALQGITTETTRSIPLPSTAPVRSWMDALRALLEEGKVTAPRGVLPAFFTDKFVSPMLKQTPSNVDIFNLVDDPRYRF